MMPSKENDDTLLTQQLPAPCDGLRERVLDAAGEAWRQEALPVDEVPWTGPVFRLAASLAAAAMLLWCAHRVDRASMAVHQPRVPAQARPSAEPQPITAFSTGGLLQAPRAHRNAMRTFFQLKQQLDVLLHSNG